MATPHALNVAIIGGGGFMGRAHSLAWSLASQQNTSGSRIRKAVLVERDLGIAEELAGQYDWDEAADDWKRVIDRDDIHIVDVVTPPQLHAEIVCYALERGKHVLCEKPLANTSADVERMLDAARTSSGRTAIGFNYRHNAAIQYAAHLVASGEIGEVLQARFEYHQDDAFGDMGWRRHKASGGSGASSDIGSHVIDMADFIVGDIISVNAQLTTTASGPEDDHDVDDGGAFLARFAGGALGVFSFSQKSWGNFAHFRFEIDGTKGGLTFDWNARDVLRVYRGRHDEFGQGGFVATPVAGGAPGVWFGSTSLGTGYLDASANMMAAFIDAVADGRDPSGNLLHGAKIQSIVDAVWRSADANADSGSDSGSTWESPRYPVAVG
ncbi:Gfo/Idh/MocA family protein [Agromyces aerolatus]|uniref:Gfo/Idh/MocA family protein n=1 Tax=Agromyces sp. LY-1074 TaxID=3074080 RepID=UPI0028581378|nr:MULTISPECIES: Gfo/Idh/MocA family oxidoreductase [unclassified Agromyces]MDR5700900.1 Gfo/Idh/MocA family oxidoreductase [Agromyces sp. LY-1074]MDR5707439.1 Gfo/Idh/MocA family oxidoreductase [Agromyces sp. LY-1358]